MVNTFHVINIFSVTKGVLSRGYVHFTEHRRTEHFAEGSITF